MFSTRNAVICLQTITHQFCSDGQTLAFGHEFGLRSEWAMQRLSHSSQMSSQLKPRTDISPVFVDDPTITRLNTKNFLRSAPNLSYDSNSYSETQIVVNDYSSDEEKVDKEFRKSPLIYWLCKHQN